MNNIKSYHLVKEKGTYVLLIHLNQIDSEFANELGEVEESKKSSFYDHIKTHVEEKFPKIDIPFCKVMWGTILVATIALATSTGVHAETTSSYSDAIGLQEYSVVAGDNLYKIATTFDVTVDEIKSTNSLIGDMIYTNQTLKIPSRNSSISYNVQAGDTLFKISQIYGVEISAIKAVNNLSNDHIYVGQTLSIQRPSISKANPSTAMYKVISGDTLWKIAQEYNVSVDALISINNLPSDALSVGQLLSITGNEVNTPTITYKDYQVVSGDNLWKISLDWGIPQSELMIINQMNESTQLKVGQIIRIPVHNIPVKPTMGVNYGEYLDWWTEAQYIVPINKVAKVADIQTGKTLKVKRTMGANHSDAEPFTYIDTEIAKSIWGGYTWTVRPVIVVVDGRKIASSMSFMPHGTEVITTNGFKGHFDMHFLNSTRHVDGKVDPVHQAAIMRAAGLSNA